nr:transmembrane protein [Tanacetum cinerariifolium]
MDHELNDWELVLDDHDDDVNTTQPTSYLEHHDQGIIQFDYFSIDGTKHVFDDHDDERVSVESDNPSWIDPVCDVNTYTKSKPLNEVWTSSSDDDAKFIESDTNSIKSDISEVKFSDNVQGETSEVKFLDNLGSETESSETDKVDEKLGMDVGRSGGEDRVMVWWKLPMDLLKYCLFKASPVWSLSVAAAMMGVVLLGRRLYNMTHKTRTLQLKVAMDDKKVSQVMNRAARLNEAFSVVKRSPIIRPALPAAGISPWPMMALR